MIPNVLAFINEAIEVTGMNSYFLYKSPFSILITLAQHLFPDFFLELCTKMPQTARHDYITIRCSVRVFLISTQIASVSLLWPDAPTPDWYTGFVLQNIDSPHSN